MNYVMSFEQYRDYKSGAKTLREIKRERNELKKFEKIIDNIYENPKLRRMAVFTIAGLNYAGKVLADTTEAMAKVDKAGFTILGLVQTIGYWLCLIMCIVEILKSIMNGSSKGVGGIMIKYVLIFASLFLMPFLFDLIREIFG